MSFLPLSHRTPEMNFFSFATVKKLSASKGTAEYIVIIVTVILSLQQVNTDGFALVVLHLSLFIWA